MLSQKRLEQAFPDKGQELRELLTNQRRTTDYQSVAAWVRICLNQPRHHDRLMLALNEVLGGHGVEIVRSAAGHVDAEYINLGDVYNETLIFDHTTATFKLQCLGDWIEIAERKRGAYA